MTFEPLPTSEEPGEPGSTGSQVTPTHGGASHKFVSFFLGEKHYATPAHAVSEVVGYLTPTRLPDAPPALLGIAPLRGDILAIVDAGASIPAAAAQPSKQKAVVFRPNVRSIEIPVAFNVDRVGELLQIERAEIRISERQDPLAEFESTIDGKHVLIIEPARIHNLLSTADQ